MGKKNTKVVGRVIDARYYPAEKSIAVIIEDFSTKKPTKPMQISASSFHFRPDQDIDFEMERTANLLKEFKHPVTLIFDPDGNASL